MNKHFIYSAFYFLTVLVLLGSCKPEDGEVGPKGTTGDQGLVGQEGIKGPDNISKVGFISGTVTGLGQDGVTPINEPFRYEYAYPTFLTKIIRNGAEQPSYNMYLTFYDSLQSTYTNLQFSMETNLSNPVASFSYGNLALMKKVGVNQYKELTGSYSVAKSANPKKGSITNVRYDEGTSLLTADYTWSVDNTSVNDANNIYNSTSSTGQPFSVTGSFSVKCVKQTVIE